MSNKQQIKLANCPCCNSDNIDIVSGVSYAAKCMSCYKVKVQCCDSKQEAADLWNNLFSNEQSHFILKIIDKSSKNYYAAASNYYTETERDRLDAINEYAKEAYREK